MIPSLLLACSLLLAPAHAWSCPTQRAWSITADDSADRTELVKFAHDMKSSQWYSGNRNWLRDDTSMCAWEGICCVKRGDRNRITEIHVERNGLDGAFSDTFASTLDELLVLNVHLNNVTNFPPGVERLSRLQEAKFGRNPICGSVPPGFASLRNLTKFNCNFCCLSGVFPAKVFQNKPHLQETFWDGNNFTGPIPSTVSNLSALTKISFNLNSMSGSTPTGLCDLKLLHDCRIGSDVDYRPYDLNSGEKAWVPIANGNLFACPVPECLLNGACGNPQASPVASPIKCT
jgi:hypothetical protein